METAPPPLFCPILVQFERVVRRRSKSAPPCTSELVPDELAAAIGQNRGTACEARPVLLAFAGRRAPLSRRLLGSMLRTIAALPLPDG